MPKFSVCAMWSVSHVFHDVEAESFEEACDLVEDAKPPYDKLPTGRYIDESFVVGENAKRVMGKRAPEFTESG